jgi:quinolinate synthase
MNISTINFDSFQKLKDEDCQERIIKAKKILGKDLLILGHHYQNEAVYRHADFAGDSLKLAQHVQNVEAKYIVFLGVHFMAEGLRYFIKGQSNHYTARFISRMFDG